MSIPERAEPAFRWRVAIAFALLTGVYAAARAIHEPNWPTDFDQLWVAARALLQGRDPYSVVGPGHEFRWDWPLYYPLPAVLLAVPFSGLAVAVARVAFSTVAAGVLGWAMGTRVRALWPLLLSAAYIIATSRTQWTPLLLASTWAPPLGFVVTAKPNVGLSALAALRPRGLVLAAIGCAAITILSFVAWPGWFGSWRANVAVSPHIVAPVLLPGGFLLVLAAIRWRRPDARLFLALACVPHTPSLYDLLMLFFVCRTLRETLVLAILTHALFWGFVGFGSGATFDAYALHLGKAAIFVVYLPTLIALLFRPNVAEDSLRESGDTSGWRAYVPATRLDVALFGVLALASALLVWVPLVTFR